MARVQLKWSEDGPERVSRVAERHGLVVKELPLKSVPQARHWHVSRPNQPGTIELTWNPAAETFILELRKGREGKWTPLDLDRLIDALNA